MQYGSLRVREGIRWSIVGGQPRCIRRYQFVSCIARGDTEREGTAWRCGSSSKGHDDAGRADGRQPFGRKAAGIAIRRQHRVAWNHHAPPTLPCLARPVSKLLGTGCYWCPGRDLNPHFPFEKTDFKSVASADFATRAC